MAIADEILVQPVEPVEAPAASKPRVLPRLAFGFLLGLVLVGGAAAAGPVRVGPSYEGRVLPGVSAAGLDLTGLDRAQATAALDKAYDAVTTGRVVVETEAGDVSVPYAQFGRRVDTAAMVDAALRAGRDGTTAERALGEIRLALDGADDRADPACSILTRSRPASTRRCPGSIVAPVDAQIVKGTDGTYTIPAQTGRAFNGTAATSAALTVVGKLDAPAEVRVPAIATVIQPALTDVEVETAKVAAERMDGKLVVAFRGQEWKLKGTKIRKWISVRPRRERIGPAGRRYRRDRQGPEAGGQGRQTGPPVGRVLQVPRPGHRRGAGEERAPPRRPRDGGGHRRRDRRAREGRRTGAGQRQGRPGGAQADHGGGRQEGPRS